MAGLFSLIYFALVGGGTIVENAKTENYKIDSKKRAIDNDSKIYTDGRGNDYFVGTDTLCEKVQDPKTGHWIIRELNDKRIPTGKVLYDYDKYKKLNERNELSNMIALAKEKGMKYFYYYFPHDKKYGASDIPIAGYDVEKERRYIIYKFVGDYYCTYMEDKPYLYKEGCNFTLQEKYGVSKDPNDTFKITKEEYYLRMARMK